MKTGKTTFEETGEIVKHISGNLYFKVTPNGEVEIKQEGLNQLKINGAV
jgi:hypothetical protein